MIQWYWLVVAVGMTLVVVLTVTVVRRRWSETSLNPTEVSELNCHKSGSNESGRVSFFPDWPRVRHADGTRVVVPPEPTPYGHYVEGSTGCQPSGVSFTENVVPLRLRAGSLSWRHRFTRKLKRKVGR